MSVAAEPLTADKPYKGPDSYRSEDAHLFFGRDIAADQVIAKILSSRFSVLHAQSGAGKTSLLNARVLPELEVRGWLPLRVIPQNDPSGAVRLAAFLQLLPSPRAEAAAIDRALTALALPRELPTINQLVDRYDDLPLRDERRRRLVASVPLGLDEIAALKVPNGETLPFFCRLLRTSINVAGFDAHLAALSEDTFQPAGELRAADLVTALSATGLLRSYGALVDDLSAPLGLVSFFDTWLRIWGSRHSQYSIVLILDQFEEMFTRFTDRRQRKRADAEQPLDWSVRDAFIKELRELYEYRGDAANGSEKEGPAAALLPIRYSISLREEFLARLDPVRCFVPDLDVGAYHLPLLTTPDAKTAIEEPASQYGYSYEKKCLDDILQKLLKEGRFIEPAHLQIVCERLWEVCGRKFAESASTSAASSKNRNEVDFETYKDLGFAEGILRNFISGFLSELGPADRLEALELLEPLITRSGTRNIVEWSQLVNRSFREPARRKDLLLEMQNRRIVRVEWRLGGQFVEITHEFLIEPILQAIRVDLQGDSETARFVDARRELERIAAAEIRSDERLLLSPHQFEILEANESRIVWSRATAEAMLRSAIVNAWENEERAARRISKWADLYEGDTYKDVAYRTGGGDPPVTPADPSAVAAEYLKSRTDKVRESAIKALAIFGEPSSIDRLVNLALGLGPDARAATDAILRLEGLPQRYAIVRLATQLDDTKHQLSAYTLLGQIHGKGATVLLPERSKASRWRTARIKVRERAGSEEPRQRWRLLEPGMVAGALGVVLVTGLLELAFLQSQLSAVNETIVPLAFGLLLGAPIMIFFALRKSDPIHLHVDQRAAALVEAGRAALASIFPWPIAFVLAFFLGGAFATDTADAFKLVMATTLIIILATAAVRLGTLLAYEAFSDRLHLNRFWQSLAGSALGMVVIALGGAWMMSFLADMPSRAGVIKIALFLLPVSFALSFAYARSEKAAPPKRPLLGRFAARGVGSGLVVVFGLLALLTGRSAFFSTLAESLPGIAALSATASRTWPIDYLPTRVWITVPKPAGDSASQGKSPTDTDVTVLGRAWGTHPKTDSLILRIFDSTGIKEYDFSANPNSTKRAFSPRFDLPLRAGKYAVEVSRTDAGDFVTEFISRARNSVGFPSAGRDVATPTYDLAVSLLTPAVMRAREAARAAGLLGDSIYALTRQLPADWTAAETVADSSIALMHRALRSDSLLAVTSYDLNDVCWWATLGGRPRDALPFCELGVARSPNDPMILDSRGVARALAGDTYGAIADLEIFRKEMSKAVDTADQRRGAIRGPWIERLKRGDDLELWRVRADTRER
ncbi:MAG: hypothetical protein WD802_03190 [Gemmatimonadaceae bacterium]